MRLLPILAAAVCFSAPAVAQQRFTLSAKPEPASVPAGSTVEVVIQVTLEPSWHTYTPDSAGGQGAQVSFAPPEGLTPQGELTHTEGELHDDPVMGRQWHLSGKVEFRQTFIVDAAAAPGEVTVPGKITLIVCDPFSCFPPQTVEFAASVKVVAGGAADLSMEDQWPSWRGPRHNGTAHSTANPPITWSEEQNVRWKCEIPGQGSSTPIVWGDQVFLLTAVATDRKVDVPPPEQNYMKTVPPDVIHEFVVLSVDRRSGDILWEKVVREAVPHEGHHDTHDYAAGSPVTDGEVLIACFGSQGVFALDLDGELLWERDLGDMRTRNAWGEAVSPALSGDQVIVPFDHEDQSFLEVLDRNTGDTLWRVERDEPSTWNTPVVVEHGRVRQLVVNGTNRLRGYDLDTGEVLWECGGQTVNAIPSPVVFDGHAIGMSGYRGNLAVSVPLGARGDVTGTGSIAWSHDRGTPYVSSPLLVEDRLYFLNGNQGLLTCLNADTGEVLVDRRRIGELGNLYASPAYASGRIYLCDREGTVVVLREGADLEVLAVNTLEDGFNASPALVGRQMFLRGRHLYCLEASGAESEGR